MYCIFLRINLLKLSAENAGSGISDTLIETFSGEAYP